ncbi:transposase [Streptomyces sp. RerS4]|uniref:transposase n=1 Tax=Streptomyces sp. RerS4 TaxID=2942449 RepID=UPI00201BA9DC|nr:transposase [Streptomyces sp. RerS4]UQW99409.1 transposase [Streptomyces sp. RerS4]
MEPTIPKIRVGSFFPSLLEGRAGVTGPCMRWWVMLEAYAQGPASAYRQGERAASPWTPRGRPPRRPGLPRDLERVDHRASPLVALELVQLGPV